MTPPRGGSLEKNKILLHEDAKRCMRVLQHVFLDILNLLTILITN